LDEEQCRNDSHDEPSAPHKFMDLDLHSSSSMSLHLISQLELNDLIRDLSLKKSGRTPRI